MAMLSEMSGSCLMMRSVGDHDLELGFAQVMEAMAKARAYFEKTGVRPVMFLDMTESEEAKNTDEIRHISDFFRQFLGFLDGKIGVLVSKQLHFGLARIFSSVAEPNGLDIRPFYERSKAMAFLGIVEAPES